MPAIGTDFHTLLTTIRSVRDWLLTQPLTTESVTHIQGLTQCLVDAGYEFEHDWRVPNDDDPCGFEPLADICRNCGSYIPAAMMGCDKDLKQLEPCKSVI